MAKTHLLDRWLVLLVLCCCLSCGSDNSDKGDDQKEKLVAKVYEHSSALYLYLRNQFGDVQVNSSERRADETMRQLLQKAGITFGDGAELFLNPVTGELVVRTSPGNHDRIGKLYDEATIDYRVDLNE